MAVAQWVGVGEVVTGWCKLRVRAQVEIHTTFFSAVIFMSVLLHGLMDFSDIVILCSRPKVLQTSVWLRPTMSDMCWHAFEHSLLGKTRFWSKETEKNKKLCGLK